MLCGCVNKGRHLIGFPLPTRSMFLIQHDIILYIIALIEFLEDMRIVASLLPPCFSCFKGILRSFQKFLLIFYFGFDLLQLWHSSQPSMPWLLSRLMFSWVFPRPASFFNCALMCSTAGVDQKVEKKLPSS